MKLLLGLILMAGLQLPVGAPTQVQNPAYPLRVKIVTRGQTRSGYRIRAFGRADLLGQASPPEQGFDFQADCDVILMITHGSEAYSARWKKPGRELEILLSEMGSDKSRKCTMKTDLKPFVYAIVDRTLVTQPLKK